LNSKKFSGTTIIVLLLSTILALTVRFRPGHSEVAGSPAWGDWGHYHNYTEVVNTLLYLNITYPSLVDLFPIGKSWLNQTIYCIRLTNENVTQAKPQVLFVSYHHARERITLELSLYFAVDAATNYGTNQTLKRMLDNCEIYIVLALNVDGIEAAKQNEWQRKNTHPFDEDNDTRFDEDPPDDEDGDGYIEDLFFDNGTYYEFIRWEGADDDHDGKFNEDWIGGVDLNRNYGYQWNATCDSGSPNPQDEDFHGLAPFSEPETQAIRDLALQHDFKYSISLHSGAELILYPWGYTHTPAPNETLFKEVAGNLSGLVGAPYQQSAQLYTTSGDWADWMYANRSTFALTCEIYTNYTAWQYEPGPSPNTWWERGVTQYFNPASRNIEAVIKRWLPVFTYTINRTISETEVGHDVAITDVNSVKTVVGQSYPVNISVTAKNEGTFMETFNVTLYANTASIGSRTVVLASGNTVAISLTWNTAGFDMGNYTLKAVADTVPNETDIADNVFIDSMISVLVPGDANGDGVVSMVDLYLQALHFGAQKDTANYVSNYDINDDGIINMIDLWTTATHYGQHQRLETLLSNASC